jgi:hypothetical protein
METAKTVKMQKGDLSADIFNSPETIAQARREGYSLADPADIEKIGDDLGLLTKNELVELARQKGVFDKSLVLKRKDEIIGRIKAAGPGAGKTPENPDSQGPGESPGREGPGETEEPGNEGRTEPEGNTEGPQDDTEKKRGFFGGRK